MEIASDIHKRGLQEQLTLLYGKKAFAQTQRYEEAMARFIERFGEGREAMFFSAPGRTEIGGNHTDHQLGCVVAAAVDMDIIAVAAKNGGSTVRIASEGYTELTLDAGELNKLDEEEETTAALVRGILSRFDDLDKDVGGFDAYITSDVPKGSGLSSSAAFSVLICTIIDNLFNDGDMDAVTCAKTAQYAENVYFNKPSGLMDELACAVGGFVFVDFFDKDEPKVVPIAADLAKLGYSLIIIDAGGSHANLTFEYAAIPEDMAEVANFFGKQQLSRVEESAFYANLPALRRAAGDRAILRAMHFFDETARAREEADALSAGDIQGFLALARESANSSFKLLQNICPTDRDERSVALALALGDRYLSDMGVCRIHGGGFAGTVLAFVPTDMAADFMQSMDAALGRGACTELSIRKYGGVCVSRMGEE